MLPWSGSDGPYNVISLDGNTIYQGADTGGGNYAGFQYYRRPGGVNFTPGATLYMEVDFKDLGGPGSIGVQYNAVGVDFQTAGFALARSVGSSGAYKTAVFKLDAADFRLAQNGGNDLRLTRSGNLRFHIREVRVSDTPGTLYQSLTAFLGPYSGPQFAAPGAADASTMLGKVIVGYQGWFRTPGDDDDSGWVHWTKNWGSLSPALISEDFWPEMAEYGPSEKFAAPGFSYPGGAQAHLFSSNNARTVLRHFQWMEAYGIDGAAVQRFTNGLGSPSVDGYRVITHARAAAHQTGRTWYVEYDMTGTPEGDLVDFIRKDWQYLIDVLRIHEDPRYLKHGGLPVAGVYGFFPERFSPATANAIIDIFKTGRTQDRAFVAGAGAWYWRTAAETTPAWTSMMYRLDLWQPWNCGNYLGTYPNYVAKTDYWAADKADFNSRGILYQPELYPGASSANRDAMPFNTPDMPRRGGGFLWDQFVVVQQMGFETVFVGMFDELDEGTQLFKVTSDYPTEASFKAYEGQPSDCYLCYTGQGAKMLKGLIPFSATKPDCPAQTQPSIPDPSAPLNGATVAASASFSWTAALALPQGGSLNRYELWIDGTVINVGLVTSSLQTLAPGNHVWRVRAVNSLGNAGGWSVPQSFSSIGGNSPTPTRTFSASPTRTPSPSPSPTRTPVPVGGCNIQAEDAVAFSDATAGNSGGQYRADDLDVEACGDTGGGYNVGWTDGGEWMEYLVAVPSSGAYDISLRVASGNADAGRVQLSVDGAALGPELDLPETGAWQTYQSALLANQTLSAGVRRLRVGVVAGGFNFNYVCIVPAATPTPSPSRTASATRTASPSPSPTRTWSVTESPTISVSASATLTRTASLTATATRTGSASPSITVSITASASATRTPMSSPSFTASGTATASATRTPMSSPTSTPSTTISESATRTPMDSPTSTASVTVSPSSTRSPFSSPTATATQSSVLSATATSTRTPGSSPSATTTSTGLPSATVTATPSSTSTGTASRTASGTPTQTHTRTGSPTPSPASTASLTGSPSPTPISTAPPSPSPTLSATAGASDPAPADDHEAAQVLEAVPVPQPDPRFIQVRLNKRTASMSLKVYTRAWVLVGESVEGPHPAGWSRLGLPEAFRSAPPGAYYFRVEAGGQHDADRMGVLMRTAAR